MSYTLATAAEVAKVSKPTIRRWVKQGKLSATKADDATYRIEPVELHRYLDSVAKETPRTEGLQQSEQRPEMHAKALQDVLTFRFEVDKLTTLLATERERVAELKEDREQWREQAQRLAITHEKQVVAPVVTSIQPETIVSKPGLFARLAKAVKG